MRTAFALQDDLTQEVSRFLRELLGEEIRLRESRAGTQSVEAWRLVRQATELRDADNVEPLLSRGDPRGAMDALDRADSLLARAESLDPAWMEPTVQRGWLARAKGFLTLFAPPGSFKETAFSESLRRGIDHAERGLGRKSNDPAALELRGTLRRELLPFMDVVADRENILELAEQDLRAAVAGDPSRAGAWATLSAVLQENRQLAEAASAARRALAEDPYLAESDAILRRLAWTSLELGRDAEARKWCDEGQRRSSTRPKWTVECTLAIMVLSDAAPLDVDKAWELISDYLDQYPGTEELREGYRSE